MWAKHKQSGFTIVELLIVIVIIAILAAISIVAYNGIQQRARNSNTATVVSAYLKALTSYAITNGSYPPISNPGGAYACLGENNPDDLCWFRIADTTVETASFNNAIKPFLGNKIPDVNPTIVGPKNGATFVNHAGTSLTVDGVHHRYLLMYLMEGANTKCPVGPVLTGYWSTYTSTVPASGYTASISGVGTECVIKLPDPATI